MYTTCLVQTFFTINILTFYKHFEFEIKQNYRHPYIIPSLSHISFIVIILGNKYQANLTNNVPRAIGIKRNSISIYMQQIFGT